MVGLSVRCAKNCLNILQETTAQMHNKVLLADPVRWPSIVFRLPLAKES